MRVFIEVNMADRALQSEGMENTVQVGNHLWADAGDGTPVECTLEEGVLTPKAVLYRYAIASSGWGEKWVKWTEVKDVWAIPEKGIIWSDSTNTWRRQVGEYEGLRLVGGLTVHTRIDTWVAGDGVFEWPMGVAVEFPNGDYYYREGSRDREGRSIDYTPDGLGGCGSPCHQALVAAGLL